MVFRFQPVVVAIGVALWGAALATQPAQAAEKVTFGTDWRAQAEHGGFYQALATGLYKKRGLDVEIRQGGPQINHSLLLAAGRVDFSMSSTAFIALNYVREKIPMVAVAAIFQKDPQVLIAHPNQGNDTLAALKGKPIYIGSDTRVGSWLFLKSRFGFTNDQIRPYTFSIAPFLVNKNVIQQGYLTSEPFLIQKQGVKPVVHLLADSGYQGYAALLQTAAKQVRENPKRVRGFVEASIEGWYNYLYGDPAPGNALIKQANPAMTDELIANGRRMMRRHGIVDSGDTKKHGIGAMSAKRWRAFHKTMASQGLYPADMPVDRAYSLDFVNRGVGMKKPR